MQANPLTALAPRPPKPPAPSSTKAGRNLKTALPVAFGLLALVAFSVVWRIEAFVCLVAVAMCVGLWEAAGAFLNRGVRIPLVPTWCGAVAMVGATWTAREHIVGGFLAFVVSAVAVCLWRWAMSPARWAGDAAAGVFALAWIGFVGCFAVCLAAMPQGRWMVALLILMPAASDTGGWAFGVLWGRRSLLEELPPFLGGGEMIEAPTFGVPVRITGVYSWGSIMPYAVRL